MNTLSVTNEKIYNFFTSRNLDFETMTLLYVDILDKIMTNMDQSVNNNLANSVVHEMKSLQHKLGSMQKDISSILFTNLTESRKEYMNDMKLLLTSNNVERLAPLIKESNDNFIQKTTLLLTEQIPKNNDQVEKLINLNLKLLKSDILDETNRLLQSSTDQKLDTNKIENYMNLIQSLISNSETRIENKLQNVQNSFQTTSEQNLQLIEFLKKFDNNNAKQKGNFSEARLYHILLNLYPHADVDFVAEKKETGDIMLSRTDKPIILIENKDHDARNIPKAEVEKFIRDCNIQNCCGIMFAQNRGIANKNNFELQVNNHNVLLYVHNVNFDEEKIKLAIDIVDNFKSQLDKTTNNGEFSIDENTLSLMNTEYTDFINQKITLLKCTKDFSDKMVGLLNDLKMPNLEKYLSHHFAFSKIVQDNITTTNTTSSLSEEKDKLHICTNCNQEWKSLRSLASHLKACSKNKSIPTIEYITTNIPSMKSY